MSIYFICYSRLTRKLTILWDTIQGAMDEILALALSLFILACGFAIFGHLSFG